jgi:hypothetical protein
MYREFTPIPTGAVLGGVRVVRFLGGKMAHLARYLVRHECCGRETQMSHRYLLSRGRAVVRKCAGCADKRKRRSLPLAPKSDDDIVVHGSSGVLECVPDRNGHLWPKLGRMGRLHG